MSRDLALRRSRAALERIYRRADSRFIRVDGVRLHCLDEGPRHGPVVMTLSAQWASFMQWDEWAPLLTDRYRVVRLDLPGHGLSGPIGSGDYSIANYTRLMVGVLDQLGIERLFLVGTSFSGVIAFRYAAVAGERLLGLVLANSSGMSRAAGGPRPNLPPPQPWLRLLAPWWRPSAYFRWKLGELLRDGSRITSARIREYRDMNNAPGRIAEAAARVRAYRAEDPLPVLASIRVPVLVQWSTHASYLPLSEAERFVAALANAPVRRLLYEGVGHLIIEDAPQATGRDARRFFDSILAASPARH